MNTHRAIVAAAALAASASAQTQSSPIALTSDDKLLVNVNRTETRSASST